MATNPATPATRTVRLKHRCAADGCSVMVPHRMLMCFADWRRVPLDIQREVNRRYRARDSEGRAALTPAYIVAVGRAVKAVREARERERTGAAAPPSDAPREPEQFTLGGDVQPGERGH